MCFTYKVWICSSAQAELPSPLRFVSHRILRVAAEVSGELLWSALELCRPPLIRFCPWNSKIIRVCFFLCLATFWCAVICFYECCHSAMHHFQSKTLHYSQWFRVGVLWDFQHLHGNQIMHMDFCACLYRYADKLKSLFLTRQCFALLSLYWIL